MCCCDDSKYHMSSVGRKPVIRGWGWRGGVERSSVARYGQPSTCAVVMTVSMRLELFFYKKTDVSPFLESKKSKHH